LGLVERAAWAVEEFREAFGAGLAATATGLLDIVAGYIFYSSLGEILGLTPLVLLVYPGILSVRGVITGILSGNLSTGLNIGSIEPCVKRPGWRLRLLVYAVFSMVFFGALSVAAMTALAATVTGVHRGLAGLLETVFATMYLSFLAVSPITIGVAFAAYRRGLDPDKIVYPVMSSVADIITTLIFVNTVRAVYAGGALVHTALTAFLALLVAGQGYVVWWLHEEEEFAAHLREEILSLTMVAAIASVTGYILERISKRIEARREIYAVYPAVLTTVGDAGSIVGSVGTTRLNLGYVEPGTRLYTGSAATVAGVWAASMVMFSVYAVYASAVSPLGLAASLPSNLAVLATANLIAIPVIFAISLTAAGETFRRGLNPDNFVNPLVSTLADMVSTAALYVAVSLVY